MILQQISEILTLYAANSGGQAVDLLLRQRDVLAALSYRLAEMAGEAKGEYNAKYFQRKITVARATQRLINEGMAFNKADSKSLIENEDYYRAEIAKEAEAYKMDLLLKQVNRVLDAMSQRISFLKMELKNNQLSPNL